ncbi:MAG: phosphoribosylamine--glycine ligase [Chlorobi bacterium]|nr:phosphoribosylamine--glycine ligase [Chlorobiota bacterium]
MNILILGSGGREHALAWKLAQSKKTNKLFIAPGNGGTRLIGKNVPLSLTDFSKIKEFVLQNSVNMVVVGPEDPLVRGITDFFITDDLLKNVAIIGPSKQGALLEGSKNFAKEFMLRHQIPTAKYKSCTLKNIEDGFLFLEQLNAPYVLKADGLAAGKGVIIQDTLSKAKNTLKEMLEGKFGTASKTVVVEEFLKGIEISVFALTDGDSYVILPEAKDYKKIGVGDTGLNTGGMGAVSPVSFAGEEFMEKVKTKIIEPTINGLQKERINYKGFIFFGLINVDGNPYVIEYNVRLGDPESEVVLPRIKSDLLDLFTLTAQKQLNKAKIEINSQTAVTVMLVSGGYPERYEKNKIITLPDISDNTLLFHAGTKFENNKYFTNGGRVLSITSLSVNMNEALLNSFKLADKITFEGKYYRNDIGYDLK